MTLLYQVPHLALGDKRAAVSVSGQCTHTDRRAFALQGWKKSRYLPNLEYFYLQDRTRLTWKKNPAFSWCGLLVRCIMLVLGYLNNTVSLCINQLTIWMKKELWIVKRVGMDNQFLSLILCVWPITLNELWKPLPWADVSPFKAVSFWHSLNNRKMLKTKQTCIFIVQYVFS